MSRFYDKLENLLKSKEKYIAEDGTLLKAKVYEDIQTMNKELIKLLLSDEEIKKTFFVDVDGTLVFDKSKTAWTVESKEFLPDSYTAYANKIGLTVRGEYLSGKNDVVLDFPYKDCILEGGQTKDDQKRSEIFYNETLAIDEVRRLMEPKVFTHAAWYSVGGIKPCKTFSEDDNLIIKGNNLLALASLLKRYEGKVKCIYIDPPYNTGSDSFNYNDNFNHSTWLTFMKNRLELARKLLRDDGVIFVQCDNNEQAYLKVLMDDIFKRENFLTTIVWMNKEGGGKSDSKHFRKKHEYILVYAGDEKITEISGKNVEDVDRYRYSDKYENVRGKYQLIKLDSGSLGWVKSLDYPIEYDGKVYYAGGNKEKWEDRQNGGNSIKDWGWRWSKQKYLWGLENDFIVFKDGNVYTKQYLNCDKDGNIIKRTLQPTGVYIEKYSNTQSNKHIKALFGKNIFNYSKPEGLIKEIMDMATNENDIVLDFHLGSGTTAAVAHKMGRRYIGIEQMDYIKDVTVERLKKVIEGEQGGISEAVNWQGGGSFVYCELLEDAQYLVNRVQKASGHNISQIKEEIYNDKRIVPYITKADLQKAEEEFEKASLEDKKKILLSLIDKNKLYVNYSELEDEERHVSEEDKVFTRSFYEVQ